MIADLIHYLQERNGEKNLSWYQLGKKFNIQSPDSKRAEKDKKYRRKSIARETQRIWENHLKNKKNLELVQETYLNGELRYEKYKKTPKEIKINDTDFEIEQFTTSPYGGNWAKYKKKENFLTEEHIDSLKEILTKEIEPLEYSIPEKNNSKGLFIFTSDKHIGAKTKKDSIYTNDYNKEEMRDRIVYRTLRIITEEVKTYGEFESLYIMDLGDALDGYNQKTTSGLKSTSSHTLPQCLNNREQHDYYVELHKELFDITVREKFAKNIYFIATANSNHGGDFEYGAMKHLETYLNIKYPKIKTFVSYHAYNHFIYGRHAIIFGHGKDNEDMKHGLPLVLNDKVKDYISDYIRVNKLEEFNIIFVSGDLHQSAKTYGKNFKYLKVLSQYGSSKWMHTNFGSGKAGLTISILNKNSLDCIDKDIFFEKTLKTNTGVKFK